MVKGVGIDIVEIVRIKEIIDEHPQFIERVFTPEEKRYCQNKARPEVHYATRFAAKEALLKSLGTGFRGVKWTDIEVCHDRLGKPSFALRRAARQLAKEKDIDRFHLSLSFDHRNAVAVVVAEGADDHR